MSQSQEAGPSPLLSGPLLRRMLTTAAIWLERHAASIDAINVFPVPDGDTGSNMARTLRAAAEAGIGLPPEATLGEVWQAAAHAALLEARGNSGVILSQWLAGLAAAFEGANEADGAALVSALALAAEAAYTAVDTPQEGTLLSVARALGQEQSPADTEATLERLVERANAAVERTPQQMPLLVAAGVVDAGARGLAVVIEGLAYGLRGGELPDETADSGAIDPAWLAGSAAASGSGAEQTLGFCTEFVIEGEGLSAATVRETMRPMGESVVVVGEGTLLHVHLHTSQPEEAFDAGRRHGAISRTKADDLWTQREAAAGRAAPSGAHAHNGAYAIVAVAAGKGFAQLFRDLGVAAIVPGGATMNPSAQAILLAAQSTHAAHVIVLPNHRSIVPAAEQAARLSTGPQLHVVATRDQAAAVAALCAIERTASLEDARAQLIAEAGAVLTGSVTHAARAVETPVALEAGQPFALLEEEIVGGASSVEEALEQLAAAMLAARPESSLLTVYAGADIAATAGAQVAERLRAGLGNGVEVELVIGGQPHYPFVVSLE